MSDYSPTPNHNPAIDAELTEFDTGATPRSLSIKENKVDTATAETTAPPTGLLATVRHGKRTQPHRILIYGISGIGKSTFGSMAKDAIFIPTEDGLDHIHCASFAKAKSFDEVLARFQSLAEHEHSYKTVVLDSLDWLERLIWQAVCHEKRVQSIENIDYGKGYAFALVYWKQIMDCMDYLRVAKGMQVIVIAHSQIEKFSDPTQASYDRFVPRLHKTANALWTEWCDDILFACLKTFTKSEDVGFNKVETKAIASGTRVLKCTPNPTYIAKNRLNLPDEIVLDYDEFYKLAFPAA